MPTEGHTLRVGITDYAQSALGDIVFVTLPAVGTAVDCRASRCGEVESTKSVSDIFAPVAGTVLGRQRRAGDQPELVNSDPYGEGWLVEIEVGRPACVDSLLDATRTVSSSSDS